MSTKKETITRYKKAIFMVGEILLRYVINPFLRARILNLLGASIGKNVRIYEVHFFNLEQGFKNLTIKDDVHIGPKCCIDLSGPITIGKGSSLSPGITILTHSDPGSYHHAPLCDIFTPFITPVIIEDYCWIGCNTTLLPGSYIHEKTVVGSCSLVKNSLDRCSVYHGTPVKKKRSLYFTKSSQ